ncbi:MAG: NADH-quinone oxidoreductase subunit H [Clostridia bacterium]|nr:NADH-quinone oxidoreductase subunit H [Clostridia bacterium]
MVYVIRVLCMLAYVVLAPFLGGILSGMDRKLSARMQGRIGPSVFQPFHDLYKLLKKQILVVNRYQIMLLLSFLVMVVGTGALFFGGFDLLLVFFVLTTACMFFVLAATVTNSPYAELGAQRELIQMLAYEPMILLTAVGFFMANGSFKAVDAFTADLPAIVQLPGVFIGLVFVLTIKLRKSPFDLSTSHHAHQELVKGVTTEFSGGLMAIVELSHLYENVFLLGLIALFFVSSSWWSIPLAIVGALVVWFVEVLIDNTSARVKWNQMLSSAWIMTAIFGGGNLLVLEIIRLLS